MSEPNQECPAMTAARTHFSINLKWLSGLAVVALLLCEWPAQADERDDEYVRIFNLVQDGDSLNTSGQTDKALAKYHQALTALQKFQKSYPDWNAKTVSYRLNYLVEKIDALSQKGSTAAASGPPSGTSAAAPGAKAANATPMAQVKLIEAGAEPRKVLRLHPMPGDKETFTMTMKMAMDMKIGEMETPAMKLPTMKMTTDLTVKNVTPDGDISYDLVVTEASVAEEEGVMPQVAEAMKSSFAGLKGMSGSGTVTTRGFNKGTNIKLPASADPQTRQIMEQMKDTLGNLQAPVPEEAIGAGGKWEVKMPIKSQGMVIDQTAAYEVVSIEGDRVNAKTTITQNAASQKIENPAMPGLKMDLIKMATQATGETTFDLKKIVAPNGTMDLHSDSSMAMDIAGQKQTMTMKMDMKISIEGK